MGGPVGLHGTDGDAVHEARRRGAQPRAGLRARRAMSVIGRSLPRVTVLAADGPMGADHAVGLSPKVVSHHATPTTRDDTLRAATAMLDADVDLLLFAGGDGTALDVVSVVGRDVPILGIPTGVKMHSAVFGTSPEATGEAAARYLARPHAIRLRPRELLDWAPGPDGRPSSQRLDTALVPDTPDRLQRAKAGGAAGDDAALDALCREIAASLESERLYVIGPGTTTALVCRHAGLEATWNGVDAILDGRVVAADAGEEELLSLLDQHPQATLLLGVIGGQGFLLGRGNQQLSARVIERIGPTNVRILASEAKIAALDPPVLHVDVGTEEGRPALAGYRRVETAPGRSTVLRVTDR